MTVGISISINEIERERRNIKNFVSTYVRGFEKDYLKKIYKENKNSFEGVDCQKLLLDIKNRITVITSKYKEKGLTSENQKAIIKSITVASLKHFMNQIEKDEAIEDR